MCVLRVQQPLRSRERPLVDGEAHQLLSESAAAQYSLHQLVTSARPDIIVDCVNTATGIAYQDIYKTSRLAYQALREDRVMRILREARRTNSDKAAGPVARIVRDAILPFALRRMSSGVSFLLVFR